MQCIRCGKEMTSTTEGSYYCSDCKLHVNDLVYREPIKKLEDIPSQNNSLKEGWICPRCGRVLAPWKSECRCYYESLKIKSNTGDILNSTASNVLKTSTSYTNQTENRGSL